jgi:hypothetical protein
MIAHFEFTTSHLHRMDIQVISLFEAERVRDRLSYELDADVTFTILEGNDAKMHEDVVQESGSRLQSHNAVPGFKAVSVCAGIPVQYLLQMAHNHTGSTEDK